MLLLLVGAAIIATSCGGEYNFNPNEPIIDDEDTATTEDFTWNGLDQRPLDTIGKVSVSGNIYNYNFRMYLGNSQCNPNPLILSTFGIPHVSQGETIYYNRANEAQYNITSISDGWVYFSIRCETGQLLKFNIAKWKNEHWIWFLKYGLSPDDGVTNIYSFYTY
ncbi:MAG TPA: hypothetical protein PLE28_00855 [bacterium]|nr:hypothetical protein [bacterium]